MALSYSSSCVWIPKDVEPTETVETGGSQSAIANGSATSPDTSKASVSKRTVDDSCCDAGGLNKCRHETAATSKASARKRTTEESCCDGGVSNKRRRQSAATSLPDERVLILVAQHSNWNPRLLCFLSCVCKKTCAISNRLLWRKFCLSRAPRMVSDLLLGAKEGRIDGGWNALGKLFLYCAGSHCSKGSRFHTQKIVGHFVPKTRFSCTAGRSFLIRRCSKDVLYMSDPCEHANGPEDVGVFRGVFKGFDKSETKKLITNMRLQLEEEEKCPFCKARVWSMGSAHMIPRSASTRLAAFNENVEYFVCLNGHVNGRCALLHLSDTDGSDADQ